MQDFIAVLDFGSQYAHLIAKRIRHLGAYTKIFSPSAKEDLLQDAKGIVLSGGPASVYSTDIPKFNSNILNLDFKLVDDLKYNLNISKMRYIMDKYL